jgi:hypothetical protein
MLFWKNYKFDTIITFLLSIAFVCVFFYWKHNPQMSKVNVFNVDPFDAVGSIAIQVSMFASGFSVLRFFLYVTEEGIQFSHVILILRGNVLSQFSIIITMISDLIALIRFIPVWINSSSGVLLVCMVILFLMIAIIILRRTLKFMAANNLKMKFRLFSLKFFIVISGFAILSVYPILSNDSIPWVLFTAYAGIIIQIVILKNLTFLVFKEEEIVFEDLIDVIIKLYNALKSHLKFTKSSADKTENIMFNRWIRAITGWINPRKHKWNLIILIFICLGALMALLEVIDEKWEGVSLRTIIVFSVYVAGEAIIIVSFYLLFRKFLGLVKWNQDGM